MSILGRKVQSTLETSWCSFCSYLSHLNITPLVLVVGGGVFLVIKWKDVELLFVKAGGFSLHCYLGYCVCSCSPYLGDNFDCFTWFL